MSQVKSKRIAPSVVNSAVTVHVCGSTALDKEQTERFLTKFIDGEETRSNAKLLDSSGATASTAGASVSQLRRIQRDLRGLPPLESGQSTSPNPPGTIKPMGKATPKKTKFEDEPLPEVKQEINQEQEEESIPESKDLDIKDADEEEVKPETEVQTEKLSKEERKRLKREAKESKKANKKAKLEK